MSCMKHALVVCWFALIGITPSYAKTFRHPHITSCAEYRGTETGPSYHGRLDNDDYGFSVDVPSGMTGWSGVADSAPFHGFAIFLDAKHENCILFEIHIRVEGVGMDAVRKPSKSKLIALGKVNGWQTIASGYVHGRRLLNIGTNFTCKRTDQMDDGSILLVTTPAKEGEAIPIYNALLGSLTFWQCNENGTQCTP
jgi:hypothetical protein